MATQDVAVHRWALTMLSDKNIGKGPLCNAIGQNLGYFLLCWVFSVEQSGEIQDFIDTYIEIEYLTRVGYGQSGWILEVHWICHANPNGLRPSPEEGEKGYSLLLVVPHQEGDGMHTLPGTTQGRGQDQRGQVRCVQDWSDKDLSLYVVY